MCVGGCSIYCDAVHSLKLLCVEPIARGGALRFAFAFANIAQTNKHEQRTHTKKKNKHCELFAPAIPIDDRHYDSHSLTGTGTIEICMVLGNIPMKLNELEYSATLARRVFVV